MKSLFATIMLLACVSVQANANVPASVSNDPVWLKDMQTVSCKFGMCKNWHTQETWDDETAQDGYTVVFPDNYDVVKLNQISPEVVRWIKVHGIPRP